MISGLFVRLWRKVRGFVSRPRPYGEFRNASTRPVDQNGFGLSTSEADRIARVIERDFQFLPDSRDVHDRWRRLLVEHDVKGARVHDARLAASMYVHGVMRLPTVNVRDFRRFADLSVIHPAEVVEPLQL